MSDWFSTWFDSPYYHLLYKSRSDGEAQFFLDNILKYIDLPQDSKVLDLACGKGRHSIYLNKKGYEVLGLDLAANSIRIANESKKEDLTFQVHDMRDPMPDKDFDLIINAFTSFGYFNNVEDDLKTLQNVFDALKSGAFFVFDFINIRQVENNLVEEEIKAVENVDFYIKRYFKHGVLYKDIQFEVDGKKQHYTEQVDALTFETLEKYFIQTGFEKVDVFGDYNLKTFDLEQSKRLIFVLKKP